MRILICSDGTDPADKPILLGGLVAAPTKAATTLLGIAETAADEKPLRDALQGEAEKLRKFGISPQIVFRKGEPVREILEQTKANAYDMVLNGNEVGGGSIRIYQRELQEKMFEALGIRPEDRQSLFGHLLRALRLGAPPHGGIALGLDRLVMLICGEDTIRDVMAFPKNNRGLDLMTQSPGEVDPKQLRDLSLKLAKDKNL